MLEASSFEVISLKQVAIFYRDRENQPAIRYIENNLLNVLGDYIQITNYYLDEMPPHQLISADAYLVCYEESFASCRIILMIFQRSS